MPFDAIIRGGRILDGTGAPTVAADIAVAGGKIAMVGRVPAAEGAEIIDAEGLFVAPGFIDIHSHSDFTLLLDPRAVSSVQQGVTLEVVGNCGHGCSYVGAPALGKEIIYGYHSDYPITWTTVAEYLDCLDKAAPAVNVATLIPNGQLRLATVGLEDRPAHTDEISRMRNLLRQGLEEGAFGFSTGLEYATEVGASEKEVCELCREVAAFDALYATHTRNRDEGAVGAVEEAVRTASDAGARLQVSHITPRGGRQDTERAIACVESARRRGEDAAFDMHSAPPISRASFLLGLYRVASRRLHAACATTPRERKCGAFAVRSPLLGIGVASSSSTTPLFLNTRDMTSQRLAG